MCHALCCSAMSCARSSSLLVQFPLFVACPSRSCPLCWLPSLRRASCNGPMRPHPSPAAAATVIPDALSEDPARTRGQDEGLTFAPSHRMSLSAGDDCSIILRDSAMGRLCSLPRRRRAHVGSTDGVARAPLSCSEDFPPPPPSPAHRRGGSIHPLLLHGAPCQCSLKEPRPNHDPFLSSEVGRALPPVACIRHQQDWALARAHIRAIGVA